MHPLRDVAYEPWSSAVYQRDGYRRRPHLPSFHIFYIELLYQNAMSSPTRVAIVTGAALGLGRAIALRLAADGLHVVVNDLPKQKDNLEALVKEIEATGSRAAPFIADVTVEENVKNLVAFAVSTFGGLDVVCIQLVSYFPAKVDSRVCLPIDGGQCRYRLREVYP